MDYTLELVVVPVSDVDRAKAFYLDKAGFELLVDHSAGPDFRVVQMVPPGSTCAIAIGTGVHFGYARTLAPGTYVLSCHFPTADGRNHLQHGRVCRDFG